MLSVYFGLREGTVRKPKSYFMNCLDPKCLEDDFIKQMVLDVDKSEILSANCINSPVLGQIAPERLSGGVLALIIMYVTDEIVDATKCGENCAKWIMEIGRRKNLSIDLEYNMPFEFKDGDEIMILNDGKTVSNPYDYLGKFSYFVYEEGYKKWLESTE